MHGIRLALGNLCDPRAYRLRFRWWSLNRLGRCTRRLCRWKVVKFRLILMHNSGNWVYCYIDKWLRLTIGRHSREFYCLWGRRLRLSLRCDSSRKVYQSLGAIGFFSVALLWLGPKCSANGWKQISWIFSCCSLVELEYLKHSLTVHRGNRINPFCRNPLIDRLFNSRWSCYSKTLIRRLQIIVCCLKIFVVLLRWRRVGWEWPRNRSCPSWKAGGWGTAMETLTSFGLTDCCLSALWALGLAWRAARSSQ